MKEGVQTSWILQNGTTELFGCEWASLVRQGNIGQSAQVISRNWKKSVWKK